MKKKKELSKDEIIHLAKLANLHLSEEEIKKYQQQLTETLDYVKNLDELKTEKVIPTPHTINLTNVEFKDGKKDVRRLDQNQTLANSKNKKNGYFMVKRIM